MARDPRRAEQGRRRRDGGATRANAARVRGEAARRSTPASRPASTACRAGERKLVTSHDAFGYFARRYGITVVGAVIPSQSTQAQPSAGQIAELAALVRREHVKAVFPESSMNPKLAEAIAAQTGARADYTLYGDTLGPAGSNGDTYLQMERANADAMVEGFTGGAQRMPDQRPLIAADGPRRRPTRRRRRCSRA